MDTVDDASLANKELKPWFRSLFFNFAVANWNRIKDIVSHPTWFRLCFFSVYVVLLMKAICFGQYVVHNKGNFCKSMSASQKHADGTTQKALIAAIATVKWLGLLVVDFQNVDWAQMTPVNGWIARVGGVIALASLALFVWSHVSLGTAWSPLITIQQHHRLQFTGAYKYARHPMYLSRLLHVMAVLLMSQNLLLTLLFLPMVLYNIKSVKREERLLIEEFGQPYVDYINKVPALGPVDVWLDRTVGLTRFEAEAVLDTRAPESIKKERSRRDISHDTSKEK